MKRRKEESNWARDTGNVETTREDFFLWNTAAMGLPVQHTIVFFFFFCGAHIPSSILLKNMEEINFQMFTPGQHLKKNCDFLIWKFKIFVFFLIAGITIIKMSSLFLPCRKALCTSVLVYPFSSFLILSPRFEESFLCRSLRKEKQTKIIFPSKH